MNSCNFIGRVGRDAEVHEGGNNPVANFTVAVDSGYGDNKQSNWLRCALWGERATKVAGYIKKGDRIGVSGELGTREYEGKTYLTLRVADVTLLGDKKAGSTDAPARQESPPPRRQAAPPPARNDSFEDDDGPPF